MADSDLINEELERVFTLYSAQLRQFRRALYALIVTSLTLFILIVVPFLTFRDQLAELHMDEQNFAVDLQEARDSLEDAYPSSNADSEAMTGVTADFRRFAKKYRTWKTYQSLEA